MNEDVANLGAIAVGNNNIIFVGEFGDEGADFASDLFLRFGGDFAVFL